MEIVNKSGGNKFVIFFKCTRSGLLSFGGFTTEIPRVVFSTRFYDLALQKVGLKLERDIVNKIKTSPVFEKTLFN